jgi:predicted nucleic acid-binding Zn ribbon protein
MGEKGTSEKVKLGMRNRRKRKKPSTWAMGVISVLLIFGFIIFSYFDGPQHVVGMLKKISDK